MLAGRKAMDIGTVKPMAIPAKDIRWVLAVVRALVDIVKAPLNPAARIVVSAAIVAATMPSAAMVIASATHLDAAAMATFVKPNR
jgi:hypothetical protein